MQIAFAAVASVTALRAATVGIAGSQAHSCKALQHHNITWRAAGFTGTYCLGLRLRDKFYVSYNVHVGVQLLTSA